MTSFAFKPSQRFPSEVRPEIDERFAPTTDQISVVVPVRDNLRGVERLLTWWNQLPHVGRPRELIVVDDGSRLRVEAEAPNVRVVRTMGRGPAYARNIGWRAASGTWIAFTDSDCVPDPGWPGTFTMGWSGEVATQGRIRALGDDFLSRFYDAHGVLRPMAWSIEGRPWYLISANALVWRPALEQVGGFSTRFRLAAGEDVDLGLRLSVIGNLRWSEEAVVAHDFEPSLEAFVRRFFRYGRGNRVLIAGGRAHLKAHFAPRPFLARSGRFHHHLLSAVAFVSLAAGWLFESSVVDDDSVQ